MNKPPPPCNVCGGESALIDVVDLNKSCEEARNQFLGLAGVPVYYALCGQCGFCFAPELRAWTLGEFESRIYNAEYVLVDPDYLDRRPRANAASLMATFGHVAESFRHLDFGGGNGLLAALLREWDWNSTSFDPFANRDVDPATLGTFDLITAFEVFEHVPDVQALMASLRTLLSADGIILFSTLLSDGNIHRNQRITWWYASPRNGHISLFSKQSLELLAAASSFNFGSFSESMHVYFKRMPPWARHLTEAS